MTTVERGTPATTHSRSTVLDLGWPPPHHPSMNRRRFLLTSLAGSVAAPRELIAQTTRVARVAVYVGALVRDGVVDALRERGWVEGRNLVVDWRGEEGSEARMIEHLTTAPADVLIVGGPHRIRAAMRATTTIPIIGINLESDPVAHGFVQTLARPGRSITGIWMDLPEIAGKQIQFLRVVPSLNRLGVIWGLSLGRIAELAIQSRIRLSRLGRRHRVSRARRRLPRPPAPPARHTARPPPPGTSGLPRNPRARGMSARATVTGFSEQ